jgi:hypothetical protein
VNVKSHSVRKEIAASKRIQRLIITWVFVALLCCLITVASYFYVVQFPVSGSGSDTGEDGKVVHGDVGDPVPRAVVVDALSVGHPNAVFIDEVDAVLTQAGLRVDLFSGCVVTVDFLKGLAGGYRVVILRMHSAVSAQNELYLFTAEPFSGDKFVQERQARVVKEAFASEGSQSVFAVNWGFVKRLMTGKFNGSVVVAMGCESGVDEMLASEFIGQGAVAFVGWSGSVLLSHSEGATLRLLNSLCVEKLAVSAAVEKANSESGADPLSGAVLKCYLP